MIRYEVEVQVREDLADRFEAYMRLRHIPEIWATGCFELIEFQREGGTRYRTSYLAATRASLEAYLANHTETFRADFAAHFPEGCTASRTVWEVVDQWA